MKKKGLKILKEIYPYIIVVIVVVLVRSFIITPAIVDGSSMVPTLYNNNVILVNKLDYKASNIKRFDVVVLKYEDKKLVKRIIGLPGEHVQYKDGGLYINGFVVQENFSHGKTDDFLLDSLGYKKIPGDKYFVVGDNRPNSGDSRIIGLIDKKDIIGKVTVRIFPINKIKKVK